MSDEMRAETTSRPYDVFVSFRNEHNKKPIEPVWQLVKHLRAEGYNPFFYVDTAMAPEAFAREAEEVVLSENCKAFILCCGEDMGGSEVWQQSPSGNLVGDDEGWDNETQKEIAFAIKRNGGWAEFQKRVMLQDGLRLTLPIFLSIITDEKFEKDGKFDPKNGIRGVPRIMRTMGVKTGFRKSLDEGCAEVVKLLKSVDGLVPQKGAADDAPSEASRRGGKGAKTEKAFELVTQGDREMLLPHVAPAHEWNNDFDEFRYSVVDDAYIPLDGETLLRSHASERGKEERPVAAPLSSWFSPEPPHNIVIFGAPGSGKATFLDRLAAAAARSTLQDSMRSAAERDLADQLRRTVDGQAVWPVPLYFQANELAEKMAESLVDLKRRSARSAEAFEKALLQELPSKLSADFEERIKRRPYLLLIANIDLVRAEIRDSFIESMMHYGARDIEKTQLRIVATATAVNAHEARRVSASLAKVIEEQRMGWGGVMIRPLTPEQIKAFGDALSATLNVGHEVAHQFRALLDDIAGGADARSYVETPFMLMAAAYQSTQGMKARWLSGPAVIYSLTNRIFRDAFGQDADELRRALGTVAADLVRRETFDLSAQEFAEIIANAPMRGGEAIDAAQGAVMFGRLVQGARSIFAEAPGQSRTRARFVHRIFRDVMAADWLDYVSEDDDWREQMERLGVWSDLADGGQRWGEPVRSLLAAMAFEDRESVQRGKAILTALREQLVGARSSAARQAFLRLILSVPPKFLMELTDDLIVADDELLATYAALETELDVKEREPLFSRMSQRLSRGRVFPSGSNAVTTFAIGDPNAGINVRFANTPVRVSEYRRFLADIDGKGDKLRRYCELPEGLDTSRFRDANGKSVRVKEPADYLIHRHSPGLWHDQSLRHPDRPVTGVTWIEAVAYCRWLMDKIEAVGERKLDLGFQLGVVESIRLPTRIEWNAAFADLSKRPEWQSMPFNLDSANLGSVSTVGLFAPVGGVYDFVGNVHEWAHEVAREPGKPHRADVLGGCYLSDFDEIQKRKSEPLWRVSPEIGFRWIIAPEG
ncbi:MAG: SUMF1/EgtB/PvdO family nonheme iron enzyme [Alphaproteobacteria bacterium]|nr:SUMF1/EgtB/PvdO family nonheme iron enzyme [Alphaproteobacteria bacterium]